MNRVRRFEFVGGGLSKFWEISHQGAQVTVRFGRIGTTGQTQIKDLGNETAAAFHLVKG
jgi:predicted DNA-binding WGR domain protein